MFGRLRHWAVAGAILPGLTLCGLATPGYLREVGPTALRFRYPPPPATNLARMALPPPDSQPEGPPAPAEVATKTNAPAPTSTPTSALVSLPAAPVPEANPLAKSNTPGPAAAAASSEPMVSPQMLLHYFSHSTNGVSSGFSAPMEFTPPVQTRPPSSTATYTTDPN